MLSKLKIKYIQTLGQKKFREEERLFIAEGPKLLKELILTTNTVVKEIYALKEWIETSPVIQKGTTITEVTEQELEKISQLTTPNQVLALVHQYEQRGSVPAKNNIILVLDTIQDPGNMGTIIRIADWFGIKQVVCSNDSADIYNPKVVQSTMGSIARVNVFYTELGDWLPAQKEVSIYAAALDGEDVTAMKKIQEGVILIGNESKGISQEILALSNTKITIPRKGDAESLNAAVATGIILSHLV